MALHSAYAARMTEQTFDIPVADDDLMRLIAEGDERSLAELYDRHHLVAFRVAMRIVRDQGRAEDVVQEAFLSVWRKGGSYAHRRGSVRSWLIGIVRNRAIDVLRAQRDSDMDDEPTLLALRDAAPSVVDQVSAKLESETIRTLVRGLPTHQREAIAIAFFEGRSHAEIAATTGLPLGTVHGRIRLGLRRLRATLVAAGVTSPIDGAAGIGAIIAPTPPSPQHRTA